MGEERMWKGEKGKCMEVESGKKKKVMIKGEVERQATDRQTGR